MRLGHPDYIVNGDHIARRDGVRGVRAWFKMAAGRFRYRLVDEVVNEQAVRAVVDYGRWIARCECGGAEYVSPSDPVFFCLSCGNASVGGRWRHVIFPQDVEAVERAMLQRPVQERFWTG